MDIFLTGATGFVGGTIVRQLIASGHRVRCLVRPASLERFQQITGSAGKAVIPVAGDCLDLPSFLDAMRGCQAVIHLVGIIREFPARGITFEQMHVEATRNVVRAAMQTGAGRFLHMSALGARGDAPSRYHQTKFQAEQMVLQSGLKYVIFRPSIIFGPGDQFVNLLAARIRRFLPCPVIGSGRVRFQPVAVENVAQGFERALTPPGCLNRVYEVGGPRPYSLNEMLDAIGRAKGLCRVRKVHIPLSVAGWFVRRLERRPSFPVTSEQLLMLQEDNVCDPRNFLLTFAIEPVDFEAGVGRYIGRV